jgi:hypothetical protein
MSKTMAVLNEKNIVLNIILCLEDEPETNFLKTYTEANPASIGGDYVNGYFYSEQPYASWSRELGNWIPPIPMPDSSNNWFWNEATLSWIELNPQEI